MSMKKKRRKKRRKEGDLRRLHRPARLADAQGWLPTYQGADILQDFERRYGVDRVCAIIELRRLGAPSSEEQEAEARQTSARNAKARAARRAARRAKPVKPAKQAAKRAEARAARARRRAAELAPTSVAEAHIDWLIEHGWTGEDGDGETESGSASCGDVDGPDWGSADWDGRDEHETVEHQLLAQGRVFDLNVTETKIECDGETVRLRMCLEADPAMLARQAWALIYAIGELSFVGADADLDFTKWSRWTLGDLLAHLSFDRGWLRFHADHVRGRCMRTTIEISPDGRISLETVDRGDAPLQWISRLRGAELAPAVEDEAWLEPLPF